MEKTMARKPSPDAPDNAALKDHIRDSANHIWLAGLGAFAKAQQEGGKVFESLIKDGLHMQQQTQQVAEEKIAQATHTMSNLASQFTERAGGSWDRLETLFEQRVAKAMHRLGWPSADDVAALHARIAALEQALAHTKPIKATPAPAKRQATKPTVTKRSATQRAATTGQRVKGAKPIATPTRTASRSTRSPQR
jgi:poly(hydroxyalkanoate) granule-associated protein